MSKTFLWVALFAVAGGVVAADKSETPKLTVFATEARVEIDAEGRVIAVQPDAKLSETLGQTLQTTVNKWRFSAPIKEGKPVGGVTFVQLHVCAAPADGGYRLAFGYQSNGPSRDGPLAPRYPPKQARNGVSTELKLTYRVEANGVAKIESIDITEGGGPGAARDFRASVTDWIGISKFKPEQVDGQPVATRISFPVEYVAPKAGSGSIKATRKELQDWAAEQSSCQVALGKAAEENHAVALDSPFKLLTSG